MLRINKIDNSDEFVDRITVWKETQEHYKTFPDLESTIYHSLPKEVLPKRFSETTVEIVKEDCIDEAIRLCNEGYNPLLLNMADWFYAGGCVKYGAATQEEELFRRSNYFKSLHQKYYPLQTFTTILSPKVEFSRHGVLQGYKWMEKCAYIDCVAAPALEAPPLTSNRKRYKDEQDIETMKEKIRMLFHVASKNGNDALVLSAWGCGAFYCPPEHTAQIFREVIDEQKGVVKHVLFAVLGNNFEVFQMSGLKTADKV
jgi:uncharacterized protein (TIGR02452 family)